MGDAEAEFDHVRRVERRAQVDVEKPDGLRPARRHELVDRRAGARIALRERAEADGVRAGGEQAQTVVEREVIPRGRFDDVVAGFVVFNRDVDHARGLLEIALDVVGLAAETAQDCRAVVVLAHARNDVGLRAELPGVVGEVGGRAAQPVAGGKAVPQDFTDAYHDGQALADGKGEVHRVGRRRRN